LRALEFGIRRTQIAHGLEAVLDGFQPAGVRSQRLRVRFAQLYKRVPLFVELGWNLRLSGGQVVQLFPDFRKILCLCTDGGFNGCYPTMQRLHVFGEGAGFQAEPRHFFQSEADIRETGLNRGKRFSRGPLQFLNSLAEEYRQVFRDAARGAKKCSAGGRLLGWSGGGGWLRRDLGGDLPLKSFGHGESLPAGAALNPRIGSAHTLTSGVARQPQTAVLLVALYFAANHVVRQEVEAPGSQWGLGCLGNTIVTAVRANQFHC